MQQKKIIIFIITLFALSSLYLFYSSAKATNPAYQNFWAVYFVEPKSLDSNFIIENYSDNANFHWEAYDGKAKKAEGDAIIKKGESRKLDVNSKIGGIIEKKLTIKISSGEEKRELYKNFEQ